ncbi:MAG: hypothetical protein DME24_06840 [Verrucomicrobia bacterium]|nr:MAG: hypothetical protein DME24_06840 [Verrucomicrobiota bacterium]
MRRIALPAIVVCLGLFADDSLMAAATLTTLHIFTGTDGNAPDAPLVLGTNGNLYGTTEFGGTATNTACFGGCGTVFEISSDGAFLSLHSFTNNDGDDPRAGLLQASDGNLYGTTAFGGPFGGLGTVFRITPTGVLTNLHTFRGNDGIAPEGTLIEGPNGILYGTTSEGGPSTPGTVFQITTNGVFATLGGVDQPAAGVILASDGNLYGTTQFGGTSTNCVGGCGTVFKITLNGVLTTLHSFDGRDGSWPLGGLVEGSDGNFYGTTGGVTGQSCSNGCGTVLLTFGTVFQVTTNGTVTRLVSFTGSNGGKPVAPLVLGPDGAFYGTTEVGGGTRGDGLGTVFKLTIQTNAAATISCVLSPASDTNNVGTTHTVFALVTSNGVVQAGVPVTFNVTAGPDLGQNATNNTVANGQATYTYSNNGTPGTDTIRATSLGATGTATKVWIAPDSVGDGIPDLWRAQYFGGNGTSTNSQSCAACDADGTGQNNLFKYVAGLNPTNSASVFLFTVQNVNGHPTQMKLIYGPIVAGRTYAPQFRTNLVSGAWGALTGFSGPTTNLNQVTITDLNATQTFKFYRIGISLP